MFLTLHCFYSLSQYTNTVKKNNNDMKTLAWKKIFITSHVCNGINSFSVAQSCMTFCDPMDCSPLGSSVHGILQARILEWVTISSSRASSHSRDQTRSSCAFALAGKFLTTEPYLQWNLSPQTCGWWLSAIRPPTEWIKWPSWCQWSRLPGEIRVGVGRM